MVFRCCVYGCSNTGSTKGIHFYRFPEHRPIILAKWLSALRKEENWKPNKYSKICSAHFIDGDFREGVRPGTSRLKICAVPSVLKFPPHLKARRNAPQNQEQKKEEPVPRAADCATELQETVAAEYCVTILGKDDKDSTVFTVTSVGGEHEARSLEQLQLGNEVTTVTSVEHEELRLGNEVYTVTSLRGDHEASSHQLGNKVYTITPVEDKPEPSSLEQVQPVNKVYTVTSVGGEHETSDLEKNKVFTVTSMGEEHESTNVVEQPQLGKPLLSSELNQKTNKRKKCPQHKLLTVTPVGDVHTVEQLKLRNEELLNEIHELNVKVSKLEKSELTIEKDFAHLARSVGQIFNPDQIERLLTPWTKCQWSQETIDDCVTLQYAAGENGYRYLHEKGFPIPSYHALSKMRKT